MLRLTHEFISLHHNEILYLLKRYIIEVNEFIASRYAGESDIFYLVLLLARHAILSLSFLPLTGPPIFT